MFERLLPRQADNDYRGSKIALWLFAILLLLRLVMSYNTIFNGRNTVMNADGIPLDSYPPGAAQTIVALFAGMGLARLAMSALGVIVLVRYRTLVPLLFTIHLLQQLGGNLIGRFLPIARVGAPPASILNLVFLGIMSVGLVLSLWWRSAAPPRD